MPISSDWLSFACLPNTASKAVLSTSDTAAKTGELPAGIYYVTNLSTAWAWVAAGPNASTATDVVVYGTVAKGVPVAPGATLAIELDLNNDALFCGLAPSGTGLLVAWQTEREY